MIFASGILSSKTTIPVRRSRRRSPCEGDRRDVAKPRDRRAGWDSLASVGGLEIFQTDDSRTGGADGPKDLRIARQVIAAPGELGGEQQPASGDPGRSRPDGDPGPWRGPGAFSDWGRSTLPGVAAEVFRAFSDARQARGCRRCAFPAVRRDVSPRGAPA